MTSTLRSFALLASIALAGSACTFTWGEPGDFDNDFDNDGVSWADDDGTTDGSGGAGGADPIPGTGGGEEGTGGGEVGEICEIQEADPYGWELCDALPMSPSNLGGTCEDGNNAFGYSICIKSYDVFNPSDADAVHSCLSNIPEADACNPDPVYACLDAMNASACESPEIGELCESWGDACSGGGDTLDVATCKTDLNAVNLNALDDLHACIADSPETTCQERYNTCVVELGSID